MTLSANRLNVEPVFWVVSEMMVILGRYVTTITAQQRRHLGNSIGAHRVFNGSVRRFHLWMAKVVISLDSDSFAAFPKSFFENLRLLGLPVLGSLASAVLAIAVLLPIRAMLFIVAFFTIRASPIRRIVSLRKFVERFYFFTFTATLKHIFILRKRCRPVK